MTKSTPNRYHDAVATAIGWTDELRRSAGRVDAEHLAAAHAAFQNLRSFPTVETQSPVLTALRTELAYAEVVAVNERLTPHADAPDAKPEPEPDTAEGPDGLTNWERDLLAAATTPVTAAEEVPWDGWSGPAVASADETPADVAERVACDLEGAAALLAELIADTGTVPEPVQARASVHILRALAGGAAALRVLVADGYAAEERPRPDPELVREIQKTRQELEIAEEDRQRLAEDVHRFREERDTAVRNVRGLVEKMPAYDQVKELAEKRAQTLKLRERELAESRESLRRVQDQLARGGYPHTQHLKDVLKALGTWAPDFDTQGAAELTETAMAVARDAAVSREKMAAELRGLRDQLNAIPGVGPHWASGPLIERVRKAAALRDEVNAVRGQRAEALEQADAWRKRAENAEREAGANASEASAWRQKAEKLEAEKRGEGAPTVQNLGHSGT